MYIDKVESINLERMEYQLISTLSVPQYKTFWQVVLVLFWDRESRWEYENFIIDELYVDFTENNLLPFLISNFKLNSGILSLYNMIFHI